MKFHYKLEYLRVPHHIITVNTNMQNLIVILEGIRNVPLDIRRAHITQEKTTLYLKDQSTVAHGNVQTIEAEVAKMTSHSSIVPTKTSHMRLPLDTQILLYNVPCTPFTTMEFGCMDRIGLLCDLLAFLEPLSVDVTEAHVTTVGTFAHNILHLTKHGLPLSNEDITYISNVFEHDYKERAMGEPLH